VLGGTVVFAGVARGVWFGLEALLAGSIVHIGVVLGLEVDDATKLTRMSRERLSRGSHV